MSSTLVDIVRVATSTTGTGTLTLGSAISGFKSVPAALDGLTVTYVIEEPGTSPTDREVGRGVYSASGGTLTRATVLASTNADAKLNLASGSAHVTLTLAAEDINPALSSFTGDSGSGGVTGLVPAPGAGDAAAGKVLGAGGAFIQPAVLFVQEDTPSNAASVVIAVPSDAQQLDIQMSGIIAASGGNNLILEFSQDGGSTYLAGTSYFYSWAFSSNNTGGGQSSSGASSILLASLLSATTGAAGKIEIRKPNASGKNVSCSFHIGGIQSNSNSFSAHGEAYLAANTNAITHVRIRVSSGNISGTFRTYKWT